MADEDDGDEFEPRRRRQRVGHAGREGRERHVVLHPDHRPQIGAHLQRSGAGRMTLSNVETVVYAAFVDEADGSDEDDPANPNVTPLQNMLSCVVMQAARESSGQITGNDVGACRAG